MSIKEKKIKMYELLENINDYVFNLFFDLESDKMLDEKIEVLEALNSGKSINEIPNYYKVLEKMPKDNQIWD